MKNRMLSALFALFSLSVFAQIPNYVPANGLVGWWPFNGNANDESGNGNNGTVNGATLASDRFGNSNQAHNFDGLSNEISITNPLLNLGVDFTISCWMSSSDITKIQQCLFNSISHTGFAVELNNENIPPNKIMYGVGNSVAFWDLIYAQGTANNYQNSIWYHVVFLKTGTQYSLFVNTVFDGSSVVSASTSYTQNVGLRIGSIGGSEFFKGNLDDFGIWNRALTQCEIQNLYQSQVNNVSQAISAGADQSICAGDNVTLNGSGGSAYQWNNNVVEGASFAPTQTATYTVNGTDSLGCSGLDTVMVTVLENAASTQNQTSLDSYTLNGQTYTQSGTYTQTVPSANGCDSVITLNLTLNFTGIHDLVHSTKILVKITDLNGKIIQRRKNTVMLFVYEDGTVERVVEME